MQNLLSETNRYFHQHISSITTGNTSAQTPDITIEEMYTFFGLIIEMKHDQRHSLKDYWSREEQYCTPFYSNVRARDRFFDILQFLHFENNDNPDYDRFWKIRKIFYTLNNKFCELYNPKEHLAVDEVIVSYKGRVVFRQYIVVSAGWELTINAFQPGRYGELPSGSNLCTGCIVYNRGKKATKFIVLILAEYWQI
jgi:hypothetical protein